MATLVEELLQYVHYHDGGVPGKRPILTGSREKATFTSIPKVDMSRMFSKSLEDRKTVGKACREVGFFYALNHDVPDDVIDHTFDAIAKFFELPLDVKNEVNMRKSSRYRGYEPLLDIKLDPTTRGGENMSSLSETNLPGPNPSLIDLKEAFLMGDDPTDPEQEQLHPASATKEPRNQWPSSPSAAFFRPAMYDYYFYLVTFSRQLLRLFALALELPENYFDPITTAPLCSVRSIHYPPQEMSSDVGIGAHTDYSWFTLVCQQGTPGLEVLNENGIWVPATPAPRSFVVNIGDFLKLITDGKWKSTVHRVRNVTGDHRYSMPFFFSPDEDSKISVLPRFRENDKAYEEIDIKKYYAERLNAARRKNVSKQD
jgi:isopenicillin N synthase-like dioxygenase